MFVSTNNQICFNPNFVDLSLDKRSRRIRNSWMFSIHFWTYEQPLHGTKSQSFGICLFIKIFVPNYLLSSCLFICPYSSIICPGNKQTKTRSWNTKFFFPKLNIIHTTSMQLRSDKLSSVCPQTLQQFKSTARAGTSLNRVSIICLPPKLFVPSFSQKQTNKGTAMECNTVTPQSSFKMLMLVTSIACTSITKCLCI